MHERGFDFQMRKRVYVVEDDESIRELINCTLNTSDYDVESFENGEDFLQAAKKSPPDLALLDVLLPGISGFEILKRMKTLDELKAVPVIFLTARVTEIDKVKGLDLGADDYITKPFGIFELLARIKAVMRRTDIPYKTDDEAIKFKDIYIDTGSRQVSKKNKPIELTYKEYELLILLIENRGRVLTRDQLLEKVWGYEYAGETRTVDVHIRTLRQKLGDDSDKPKYIATIRSVGYKFEKE